MSVHKKLYVKEDVNATSLILKNGSHKTTITTNTGQDYAIALPDGSGVNNSILVNNGSGNLSWSVAPTFTSLTTDTINADTGALVTISNNLTVSGDLTVSGTTTVVDTDNTSIKDNIILLNSGETGNGVSDGTGTSGIEIERGTATNNATLLFNDNGDYWSTDNGSGTSYRLPELAITTAVTSSLAAFDANGRLVASSVSTDSTFNDITVNDIDVAGDIILNVDNSTTSGTIGSSISVYNTSGGAIIATLPTGTIAGKTYIIYLKTAGNDLTIEPGTNTIDGSTDDLVLDTAGQRVTLCAISSTEWIIL